MNQIEPLESRVLMSASLASRALSQAVIDDRSQIRADLLKFRTDAFSCFATTSHDLNAITAAHPGNASTVLPPIRRMRKDLSQVRSALASDHLADRSNVVADESLIIAKRRRVLLDHDKPAALVTDRQLLSAGLIRLQQDMLAGLDMRIAARQSDYNTIFNDGQVIINAVQSDPVGGTKVQGALATFVNDRTACINTLMPELQLVAADREQLATDLTAMQSA
jgi:hypothetical protein